MKFICRYHALFGKLTDRLQPLMLLAFRLSWGWQFFTTGRGKLLNHSDVAEFFSSLNIPFPDLSVWFIGGVECIGGLLLLAGLASRPTSLVLFIAMSVAYWSVQDDRVKVLNIFNDPTPFLTADPFFFWLTALLVLAFGPGQVSVDWLIAKWLKNRKLQAKSAAITSMKSVADSSV